MIAAIAPIIIVFDAGHRLGLYGICPQLFDNALFRRPDNFGQPQGFTAIRPSCRIVIRFTEGQKIIWVSQRRKTIYINDKGFLFPLRERL